MKKVLIIELIVLAVVVTLLTGAVGYAAINGTWEAPEPAQSATEAPIKAIQPSDPVTVVEEEVDDSWLENVDLSRSLIAGVYFVYDLSNDTFLASSHTEDTRVYPASITKLMTSLVATQYLDGDEVIVAGDELDLLDPDSSLAGIQKGDSLTATQLVEAMMLPSGNDASHIVAAAVGRKLLNDSAANAETAIAAFVGEMNRQAELMGMTGTHFVTPDGIHDELHYTTIRDLTVLGRQSLDNVLVRQYAGLVEGNNPRYDDTLTEEDAPRQWINTNATLNPASVYYCPYAVGLKTGQTNAAGICLLSAFKYKGDYYLVGVFQSPTSEDRFADTVQLFAQYVFNA